MKSQSTRFTLAPAMVLTLFLAACGAAAPPVAELGFEENFAQEFCRFGSMEGSTSKGYGCIDGVFRAWIDNDQEVYDFIAASAGERLGDVRLEADVRFVEGADAGAYLLCRGSQESGSFYLFRLGADGHVEITDYLDGEEKIARLTVLDEGMLQPGWNRLRADCLGNQLSLYLNGQRVLEREMEGEALGPGDFALGAGGASEGLSDVYFDNLVVSTP